VRRLRLGVLPRADGAGIALLLVLLALCAVVWVGNPIAALLLIPALHLWLVLASPELRPRAPAALGLVALALSPFVLLLASGAAALGLGPGAVAWAAVLLLAGGHVGIAAAALWSLAFGCAAAAALLALTPAASPPPARASSNSRSRSAAPFPTRARARSGERGRLCDDRGCASMPHIPLSPLPRERRDEGRWARR
jgi:hypothetical protein